MGGMALAGNTRYTTRLPPLPPPLPLPPPDPKPIAMEQLTQAGEMPTQPELTPVQYALLLAQNPFIQ